jgi:hypothetical protein
MVERIEKTHNDDGLNLIKKIRSIDHQCLSVFICDPQKSELPINYFLEVA